MNRDLNKSEIQETAQTARTATARTVTEKHESVLLRDLAVQQAYDEWCDFVCNVADKLADEPDILHRTHRDAFNRIMSKALEEYHNAAVYVKQ